jgi:undecaprenyl-diphosphatase
MSQGRAGWRRLNQMSRPVRFVLGAIAVTLLVSVTVFVVTIDDVVEHNGLTRLDGGRLGWFVHHRPEWLVSAARWVTDGGSVPVLLAFGLLAGVLLYRRGQTAVVAAIPAVALLTAGALTAVLKPLVGRVRPPLGLRLLTETEPSFPSGHATDSTALFVSLALVAAVVVFRRPLARAAVVAAGFAIAGVIGLTRLFLGVHWPTDVMAGWALGTSVALIVTVAFLGLTSRQRAGAQT